MVSDIEEMFKKVRKIRCMHGPRYSVYDKVSKTQIYMDSILGNEPNIFHIAWKAKSGVGTFGSMHPQAEFNEGSQYMDFEEKFKPIREALNITLTISREGKLEDYKIKPSKELYKSWEVKKV